MVPEARHGSALVVAVLLEPLLKEGVDKGSQLWESVNTITNFKVDPAVDADVVHKLVLVNKSLGVVAQFDLDVISLV